jgi:exodeoxyribonuclease VII small subunit
VLGLHGILADHAKIESNEEFTAWKVTLPEGKIDLRYIDMTKEISDLAFEQALRELEVTVAKLEAGDLTLEESLALFERGQKLAARCNDLLEKASLRVEQLTKDGEIVEVSVQVEE